MAESGLRLAIEFWNYALGQHFAQLNAPLVKRINIPDNALGEDGVLVKSNELAERFQHEPFGEERIRRAVALEDAMRHEPIRRALSLDLVGRLTEGQGFGLSEHVCQEYVVVPAKRVERPVERDEVAWNESRSLMNQLVERVLAICAWFAPIDRAGIVRDFVTVERDVFAVAFHRQLLQIGCKSFQVLLVRKNRDGLGTEEIVVPKG